MKKALSKILLLMAISAFSSPLAAYAGTWQVTGNSWKYQDDDGSYLTDSWLTDNGADYYFDSNGIMLDNTLSPDGYPLGRDGRKLSDNEILPVSFSGSTVDFVTYHNDVMNYCDGFDKSFNTTYDELYPAILNVKDSNGFSEARSSVTHIDAYDFTPYLNSPNAVIRKLAINSEIFRIEQVFYLSEIIAASEQRDWNHYSNVCDSMLISVDKYADNFNAVIDQLARWDVY